MSGATPELPSAELRALAEAVIEDRFIRPWEAESHYRWDDGGDRLPMVTEEDAEPVIAEIGEDYQPDVRMNLARYIAAANPSAILALLDRLATAEVARDKAVGLLRRYARIHGRYATSHDYGDDCLPCDINAWLAALDAGAAEEEER